MAKVHSTQPSKNDLVVSYETIDGTMVSVPAGRAFEYSQVKMEQLHAMTWLMAHGELGCSTHEERIIRLIANSLAHEVDKLIPIVRAEAAKGAA